MSFSSEYITKTLWLMKFQNTTLYKSKCYGVFF